MATGVIRVDPSGQGIRRKGAGTGFFYTWSDGTRVTEGAVLDRIRSMAIPPAWKEVWICAESRGHIQATGVDEANRRQYIYHEEWTEERRAEKFQRALSLGWALPNARRRVTSDLRGRVSASRRAHAAAFRLLDTAGLRIGSRQYVRDNGTFGVTTLQVRHARAMHGRLRLCFVGKGGKEWDLSFEDSDLIRAVSPMLKRAAGDSLLAYPLPGPQSSPNSGSSSVASAASSADWQRLSATTVNEYIREVAGEDFSAKDLRTWRATVVAARELPWQQARKSDPATRQKMLKRAVAKTADFLADTPAIARRSYIDPRLFEAFLGSPVKTPPRTETIVRELLDSMSLPT